jgi:hypothetical protein
VRSNIAETLAKPPIGERLTVGEVGRRYVHRAEAVLVTAAFGQGINRGINF